MLSIMEQAELKEILAVPVPLTVDMLKQASSSNESVNKEKRRVLIFSPCFEKTHLSLSAHLSDGVGQDLDDLVVGCSDNALPVYFDDSVPNANASSFSDTTAHQAADLPQGDGDIDTVGRFSVSEYFLAAKREISLKPNRKYSNLLNVLTMPSSTLKPS